MTMYRESSGWDSLQARLSHDIPPGAPHSSATGRMQASGQASFSQLTSKAAKLLRMRGATLLYVASAVS